jgi:hypothetical protein
VCCGFQLALGAGAASIVSACVPDLGAPDPIPELQEMQFNPDPTNPRVPQPTSLIVNTQTGRLDFSLAGVTVPDDCSKVDVGKQAECLFDHYLESLDGYPTSTPGSAPASAELDPATLTPGQNVVVVATKAATPIPAADLMVGFDAGANLLNVRAKRWAVGEFYWAAVRGYANGVKAKDGSEVIGSLAQLLLKQPTSLVCDAPDVDHIDPNCPTFALVAAKSTPEGAFALLSQLEPIRVAYQPGFQAIADWGGIPRSEVAVLWGFPIHSASVAELDPSVGIVPQATAPDEMRVSVQGPVDPASVLSFVPPTEPDARYGSVVVFDLTNLALVATRQKQLPDALPAVDASYADGAIVIKGRAPFTSGDTYGVFLTRDPDPGQSGPPGIRDDKGRPLVLSPVTRLLTLTAPLVDADQHSTVSSVSDADAQNLEGGRVQFGMVFDSAIAGFPGITRDNLVYCFGFEFQAPP